MKREGGYTLVELMVVLSLASLLMTAVPFLSSHLLPGARFDRDVNNLRLALESARAEAHRGGHKVLFDLASDKVDVSFVPDPLVTANANIIVFFAEGGATGGVLVVRSGSRERQLAINWLTGLVTEVREE